MSFTCANCGQPMKEIPAGVSKKTGKPYSAFFACDGCKQTHNPANVAPPVQAPPPPPPYQEPTIGEQFAQKDQDKNRTITRLAVLKAACGLHSGSGDVTKAIESAKKLEQFVYEVNDATVSDLPF